ncbi:hypothetical protein [Micromonospora sagamiensis]|uniref:Uncharacterized protein n=1 Tax=Micromonospora sagamiensis TaxID=47875 RepID=A0A562WE59_9ACTN|nr:hypothetical protein [Micromonospora sagamiensis]TWJ28573.1 hypothetical protein JD81_02078 [Micromonospora sagamiensis]BCL12524.1 hypothetical protein GCM10017556_02630 [Micromonospora sagamiensis]
MGRTLSSALTAALVVGTVAIAQPAQAAPSFTTTPPDGCYLDVYTHQGFVYSSATSCTRGHGLHRAVARCSDGQTVYGFTEEMEYSRTSIAECRSSVYPWEPMPAVEVWGEYWIDF